MTPTITRSEDYILELRRLQEHPAFVLVNREYDTRTGKLMAKLLDANTPDAEALKLRAALSEMKKTSPVQLLHDIIAGAEARLKKQHPRMGR